MSFIYGNSGFIPSRRRVSGRRQELVVVGISSLASYSSELAVECGVVIDQIIFGIREEKSFFGTKRCSIKTAPPIVDFG